jgi:hypothetical protein
MRSDMPLCTPAAPVVFLSRRSGYSPIMNYGPLNEAELVELDEVRTHVIAFTRMARPELQDCLPTEEDIMQAPMYLLKRRDRQLRELQDAWFAKQAEEDREHEIELKRWENHPRVRSDQVTAEHLGRRAKLIYRYIELHNQVRDIYTNRVKVITRYFELSDRHRNPFG